MTLLNTGSTKKFAAGWDQIFRGASKNKHASAVTAKKKAAAGNKPSAKKVHSRKAKSKKSRA